MGRASPGNRGAAVKEFLGLPELAGLEGLRRALAFRLYAPLNRHETVLEGNTLTFYVRSCRVQDARARKGMPFHPCKPVGLVEYTNFARVIDPRITTEAVSCYPDMTDESSRACGASPWTPKTPEAGRLMSG